MNKSIKWKFYVDAKNGLNSSMNKLSSCMKLSFSFSLVQNKPKIIRLWYCIYHPWGGTRQFVKRPIFPCRVSLAHSSILCLTVLVGPIVSRISWKTQLKSFFCSVVIFDWILKKSQKMEMLKFFFFFKVSFFFSNFRCKLLLDKVS